MLGISDSVERLGIALKLPRSHRSQALHIVPTLCVGMPSGRSASSHCAIIMRRRASGDGVAHAERGNDKKCQLYCRLTHPTYLFLVRIVPKPFASFPRSAWECRQDALRPVIARSSCDAERLGIALPTRSVGTINLI
jgi:hypothetical protein